MLGLTHGTGCARRESLGPVQRSAERDGPNSQAAKYVSLVRVLYKECLARFSAFQRLIHKVLRQRASADLSPLGCRYR